MKPRFFSHCLLATLTAAFGLLAPRRAAALADLQEPTEQEERRDTTEAAQRQLRYEERLTVTANRLSEFLLEVGSSVTVISAEEIADSGARWLIDVLERVPGVTLVRTGPPGAITSVFLRGTNSNHTLFLVNGVKINSPSTGAYNLAHLPASRIERIEIVRGPQSPLYGSEALGGVINVITRNGAGPLQAGIEADGGSFDTGRVEAWLEGRQDRFEYSASVYYYDSNGFSAADAARGNIEEDGYENLSVDTRVGYRFASGLELEGFFRAFDASIQIDDFAFGIGPIDDLNFLEDSREIYSGFRLGHRVGRWNTSLTVSDSEIELADDNPDGSFLLHFGLDASIREIDWQNELALAGQHTLIGGVEYRRERAKVESATTFGTSGFDEDVDVVGVYLHDRVRLADRFSFAVGGRYEDHSVFGGHTTLRATASTELVANLRLHGSAATGFRAPSLNDLYFPFFGNLAVQPEESTGLDIGLETYWSNPEVRFDVTYFRNDIKNLIQFSPVTFQAENIGNALTEGVEVSGEWVAREGVSLGGNYTFTDAVDEDLDLPLIRRPRHQGSVRVTLRPHRRITAFTEVRAKGQRLDNGPAGRVSLESFALWNAAASIAITPRLSVTGRLENLLDEQYQEVFGFGAPGLSGYVGLRVRLGSSS